MGGTGEPLSLRAARAWRPRRWVLIGSIALALVIGVVAADTWLLVTRIAHVQVTMPPGGRGTTYVIAGSDSRSTLPPGADTTTFGSATQVPSQRSDVVLVVHVVGNHTSILSIPRDMLVSTAPGQFSRLTLTLLHGPQALVNGLCRSLAITTTHLIIVNFRSFAEIIDTLGGISVDLPYPVRDPTADLSLPRAGTQQLNGLQALALVRSRTPQWRIDGRWTSVPDGSTQRTDWAGKVFAAVLEAARHVGADPFTWQSLAWTATGNLTTDHGTGPFTLLDLARVRGSVESLASSPIANTLAVRPDAATYRELAQAGYSAPCRA